MFSFTIDDVRTLVGAGEVRFRVSFELSCPHELALPDARARLHALGDYLFGVGQLAEASPAENR